MNFLKEKMKSPYMILVLFALKLLVYYSLIDARFNGILFMIVSIVTMGFITYFFSKSKLKRKRELYILLYTLLSVLMFADSMYYNYYSQTVSIKQLWQAANVAAVPQSFIETLIPASFLLYLDIPLVYYYFNKLSNQVIQRTINYKKELRYIILSLSAVFIILVTNPFNSVAIERVRNVEFFTNHVSDIYGVIADNLIDEVVSVEEVLGTVKEVTAEVSGSKYNGIGKDYNLILIQVEALQNFVINATYNGEEITPNLNALLKQDTLYFDKFYSNIGKGNTVDAEFSTLNSLYPVIDRESYTLYQDNEFNGLPWLLRERGYDAFTIHGYKGEFWNRENAYPNQGIDEFYSLEDLDASEIIGMGISDKSMFNQAMDIMKEKQEPFFSFIITLTNHHPYVLDDEDASLTLLEEHVDTKFGNYLRTVRYTDEALGDFINQLKEADLYDNTIIALYGDHHGLNVSMDDNDIIVSEYLGKNYDYDEMLKVPMMIHVPNSGVNETISTTGGQIDFLPTIANIMDIELDNPFVLGQDLANADHGFVAFTAYLFDGSFVYDDVMFEISREGIFEGSRAWNINTGEELDASLFRNEYEKAVNVKKASVDILEQNLITHFEENPDITTP